MQYLSKALFPTLVVVVVVMVVIHNLFIVEVSSKR
jgi:hypothetical protein